jgi:hypothetical protein
MRLLPLLLLLPACSNLKDGPTFGGGDDATEGDTGTTDSRLDTGAYVKPVPGYCYTFRAGFDEGSDETDGTVEELEIDMATGAVSTWMVYADPAGLNVFDTQGVAWNGSTFVLDAEGDGGPTWMELDPARAEATEYGAHDLTSAIAWTGSDYIVASGTEASRFATFADVVSGSSTATLPLAGVSRITAADGRVYGMWHSTEEMSVFDGTTGASIREIALEGYDTWTWGVSVFGGSMFSIDDGRQYDYQRIAWFERGTGALLGEVEVPRDGHGPLSFGLYCSEAPMVPP